MLVATVDNPGTDMAASVSIRRSCEQADTSLACGFPSEDGGATAFVPDAEPGEYFIWVTGSTPSIESVRGPIAVDDPDCNVRDRGDLSAFGIDDGCRDAFDQYGQIYLRKGAATYRINVAGGERDEDIDGTTVRVRSEFAAEDVWRVTLNWDGELDIAISGDLGSDGSTQYFPQVTQIGGGPLEYLVSNDGGLDEFGNDPQLVHMLVPRQPEDQGAVELVWFDHNDNPILRANEVSGGATFYLSIADVPYEDVEFELLADLRVVGTDLPPFGQFELSVGSQACTPGVESIDLTEAGRAIGLIPDGDGDATRSPVCGRQEGVTDLYTFTVPPDLPQGALLRASLDHPGTDFVGAVDIRSSCDRPESSIECNNGLSRSGPRAMLPDPMPGQYVIAVSGLYPIGASRQGPIRFDEPECDMQDLAEHFGDLQPTGIVEGCRDAFDGFGTFEIGVGDALVPLDVSAGERIIDIGGRDFHVRSRFASEDVWRVDVVAGPGEPIDVTISGGLGSDLGTQYFPQTGIVDGVELPYLVSNDGALDEPGVVGDPQIVFVLVPESSEQLGGITYEAIAPSDRPTIRGAGIGPSFSFYVAVGYAPHQATFGPIAEDIRIDAPPEARPTFGNYELSVDVLMPE